MPSRFGRARINPPKSTAVPLHSFSSFPPFHHHRSTPSKSVGAVHVPLLHRRRRCMLPTPRVSCSSLVVVAARSRHRVCLAPPSSSSVCAPDAVRAPLIPHRRRRAYPRLRASLSSVRTPNTARVTFFPRRRRWCAPPACRCSSSLGILQAGV